MAVFAFFAAVFATMTVSVNKYYNHEYYVEFDHYETYRDYFKTCRLDQWEDAAQVLLVDDYP